MADRVEARALVLAEPLSFWGGVDPATGLIVDARHPQVGESVAGRVLVMRTGRGSSSSSSVLAECLANGTGPAAVLLGEPDAILVVGALVAAELGGHRCPVQVIGDDWRTIRTGDLVVVPRSEELTRRPASPSSAPQRADRPPGAT
jgi:predicted aconitase with swiveling domain